jgi:hypothetical protein
MLFIVGVVLGLLFKRNSSLALIREIELLREQMTSKDTALAEKDKELLELSKASAATAKELETINRLKTEFLKEQENAFKALSSEALNSNNRSFLELAIRSGKISGRRKERFGNTPKSY